MWKLSFKRAVEVPQDKVGPGGGRETAGAEVGMGYWTQGLKGGSRGWGRWEGANSTEWAAEVGRESMEDRGGERVCRK